MRDCYDRSRARTGGQRAPKVLTNQSPPDRTGAAAFNEEIFDNFVCCFNRGTYSAAVPPVCQRRRDLTNQSLNHLFSNSLRHARGASYPRDWLGGGLSSPRTEQSPGNEYNLSISNRHAHSLLGVFVGTRCRRLVSRPDSPLVFPASLV